MRVVTTVTPVAKRPMTCRNSCCVSDGLCATTAGCAATFGAPLLRETLARRRGRGQCYLDAPDAEPACPARPRLGDRGGRATRARRALTDRSWQREHEQVVAEAR